MGRCRVVLMSILPVTFAVLGWLNPTSGPAWGQELPGPAHAQNATFVALAKCAACHFEQYKDWKDSRHHRAFDILPLKYRNDASCLKCHTTGSPDDAESHQFGVSCQACHGPGQEHSNFALQSANQLLTDEGLTTLRSKIQRLDMRQCVNCHVSKAHKKHPAFDRDPELPRPAGQVQSTRFFDNVHGDKTASR